jgi:hypothetical protein
MNPAESPGAECLSQRILKAAAGKSFKQLISLQHPPGVGIP